MSLADSIYEASDEQNQPKSLVDILVERAVEKSVANRPDPYSVYQLHMRGEEIWYGHERVKEIEQNAYILTDYEVRIPQPVVYLFWDRLKSGLPILDTNYIQISDNLLWDKTNGEIINLKEENDEELIPSDTEEGTDSSD